MSHGFDLKVPMNDLGWSTDSPDVGDPACICSWCGKPIERGTPIRLYWKRSPKDVLEARFHDACCEPVFGMKVQSLDDDDDDDDDWWPD